MVLVRLNRDKMVVESRLFLVSLLTVDGSGCRGVRGLRVRGRNFGRRAHDFFGPGLDGFPLFFLFLQGGWSSTMGPAKWCALFFFNCALIDRVCLLYCPIEINCNLANNTIIQLALLFPLLLSSLLLTLPAARPFQFDELIRDVLRENSY